MKDLIELGVLFIIALTICLLAVIIEVTVWSGAGFALAFVLNLSLPMFGIETVVVWWKLGLLLWGACCLIGLIKGKRE